MAVDPRNEHHDDDHDEDADEDDDDDDDDFEAPGPKQSARESFCVGCVCRCFFGCWVLFGEASFE